MNKLLYAIIIFVMIHTSAFSQIITESAYPYSGAYTYLALSGNKFYVMDVPAAQCRIYNTNHTLWKTINLPVPANNYLYDVKFISENLFTTDNSLCLAYIYYSYNDVGQYYTYTAKIIKENGTVLLTLPGCQYLYLYKLASGAVKLTAYSYNYSVVPATVQTSIYALPGTLVTSVAGNSPVVDDVFQSVAFPNPAPFEVNIPYVLPEGFTSGTINLMDVSGKLVQKFTLNGSSGSVQIQTAPYPKGTYFYTIETGSYRSARGKLVFQ